MPILKSLYKPQLIFRNAHIHTIYPALFRKPEPVNWQRQRIELPDGDFLDLDWKKQNSKRLIVLCHGLEGSSNSSYNLAATALFYKQGFDVLAWNHRGCSGEMNRLPRMYHHGVSDDLHAVLQHTHHYQEIHCIGYSLGGNVLLKYLGEDWLKPTNLKSAVAISAPVDLGSSVREIHRKRNALYHYNFLKSLKEKVRLKAVAMPEHINAEKLKLVKTLYDLDFHFTAGLHGFSSPEDYHQRASSKPFLSKIKWPTLLLQAQDDPMIGPECYPYEIAKKSEFLHLVVTKFGGHVGFIQPNKKWHYMEEMALKFITENSALNAQKI